jgi:hypothetical protein
MKRVLPGILVLVLAGNVFGQVGIVEIKPLKRGKQYQIFWTANGETSQSVSLVLKQGNVITQQWDGIPNSGSSLIKISNRAKVGQSSLLVVDGDGREKIIQEIRVRRKIPLLVKVLTPVVGVLVILAIPRQEQPIDMPASPALPD